MTSERASKGIPRPEYPRPQLQRDRWLNLNGTWTFTFDFGVSGTHPGRDLSKSTGFTDSIVVPFCPESKLSGVCYKDFIPAMWYHRVIHVPEEWAGMKIRLHFGGADYECEAFIDGISAGVHFGGAISFEFDITGLVKPGAEHHLVVRIKDETRSAGQPRGKQCPEFKSFGCCYTRTTGIWQTVWMEAVHPLGLKDIHILPDLDGSRFIIEPRYLSTRRNVRLNVIVETRDWVAAEDTVPAAQGTPAVLKLRDARAWSPDDPFLYEIEMSVLDESGEILDGVKSYSGLRKVHIEGDRVFLNNEPLYHRFVLDQGFYPEGVWTAPSDAALKRDIELAMNAGFNGARLHQKVFEERFHYWADKLGYLTWGETPSWGCNPNSVSDMRNFLSEWAEIIARDRNHPSIIAWTPWNETADCSDPLQHARAHRDSYDLAKSLDPTRPVNDASGFSHVRTDLWTVHNYEPDPAKLRAQLTPNPEKGVWRNIPGKEAPYENQPYIVDEYGGTRWVPSPDRIYADNTWGYGDPPKTDEEFYARLEALTSALLSLKHVQGYCYTQLTDVEQEQNGIYNYDRTPKFDMTRIRSIFSQTPNG